MDDRPRAVDLADQHGARAGYEPILRALLALYPAFAITAPNVRQGYQQVAHLAHGWYMRCHRGVEAVLALERAGYAEVAAPIRRSVIEHVVALKWLAVEGDRIIDTVARGHANDVERLGKYVEEAGWTSVNLDEFTQIIEDIEPDNRDSSSDNLRQFAHRCAKYGDVHTMPGYVAECGQAHPSYESAASYVDIPGETLRSTPRPQVWQVPFCTSELLEAVLAIREVFDPQPWGNLDDLIKQYQMVTNEVRREDGLRVVDWSTGQLIDEAPEP